MRIIGINSNLEANNKPIQGGSVALIVDGVIEMAIAEDRISRIKHEGGYSNALQYVLKYQNLTMDDIDYFYISFYGNKIIPNLEMVEHHINDLGLKDQKEKLVLVPSHHFSHAALAYFLSPFEEAIIVVMDNEGNILHAKNDKADGVQGSHCERNSYYVAKGNMLYLLERDFESPKTVGFGKAYNKFTRYIGLGNYHNAGKTMGLSSYGELTKEMEQVDIWSMDDEGHLQSNMVESYDSYQDIINFFIGNQLEISQIGGDKAYETKEYKNLAFYIQHQLNKWSVEKVRSLVERTGIKNICISGGVALNGIMNAAIEKELQVKVFVPPFPSDQGQSLGNAVWGYIDKSNLANNPCIPKNHFKEFTYLGSSFDSDDIQKMFEDLGYREKYLIYKSDHVVEETAQFIAAGKIIGWYQGKSEYGARALGNRSVIADPRSEEIRDKVNVLKQRELFRPLAPSVLAEHVNEFFEAGTSYLNPYMLGIVQAKNEKRDEIKGVVHVDNSSRIQSVSRSDNQRYYDLIDAFYQMTEIPMILNTSFNVAGEPIVETPMDAIHSFEVMQLDVLVCEDIIVRRHEI